jgi:hypothetical protein
MGDHGIEELRPHMWGSLQFHQLNLKEQVFSNHATEIQLVEGHLNGNSI